MYLAPDDVHSWCVPLDVPGACADLYATLAPDERDRCARFRADRDRRRFIVAHGVLRMLVGRYVGIDPGALRFVCNAFGKPALSPGFGSRLKFSLSHSADLALIAIAYAEIGVDIERIRPQPDYDEIAHWFFSAAEVDQINRLPSRLRDRAFLRYWTKKEAYVKARGEGLAHAPAELYGRWSVYSLQPASGYVGALAVEGSRWRLMQRRVRCAVLAGAQSGG